MYYVLHKPHGTDKPWLELPCFRSVKDAREAVKTLEGQRDPEGNRIADVKLCIGKGRNRRDVLVLEGERRRF